MGRNTLVTCPHCAALLDVGDEKRSIVALCLTSFFRSKGQIWACELHQWGNVKTRVECASDADVRDETGEVKIAHVIQTDPPQTAEALDDKLLTDAPPRTHADP